MRLLVAIKVDLSWPCSCSPFQMMREAEALSSRSTQWDLLTADATSLCEISVYIHRQRSTSLIGAT